MEQNLVQVFLTKDSSKYLRYTPQTTARQLLDELNGKIELVLSVLDFCLFEVTPNRERLVGDDEIIYDIIQKWPQAVAKSQIIPECRLMLHRVFYMGNDQDEYKLDPAFRSLMFQQAKDKLQKTPFNVPELVMVRLASYYIQHQFGNCYEGRENFITKQVLQHIMPQQQLNLSPESYVQSTRQYYMSLQNNTQENIELEFLQLYQQLPFSGMETFQVRYVLRGTQKLNSKMYVGLNKEGLHFFEPPGMNSRGFYHYKQIQYWTSGPDVFTIKTDEAQEGVVHQFQTSQGQIICGIIQGYVLRILAQLTSENE